MRICRDRPAYLIGELFFRKWRGHMSEREMGEKERGCMDAAGQLESVAGRLGQIKPIQQQAMAQLLGGYSLAAVARNVKVNRKTLYNWLRRDEKFKAALNSWR